MTFLVMSHNWHQCQCNLMSMASLHSLGQDDKNEVQHHFSCHGMPLALVLASHDAVSILSVTITFLRSRQLKLDVTLHFCSCDTIGINTILLHWC